MLCDPLQVVYPMTVLKHGSSFHLFRYQQASVLLSTLKVKQLKCVETEGCVFSSLSWVLEPLLSALLRRMPDLEALQIMQLVNCPESFTPDMRCIMGESPTVRGYFVLAGMNSAGISYGGGAGK